MTQEEKAKAYDKALELARVAAFNGHQSLMEGIFPELAEPEDEKTRKRIIALVNAHGQGMYKDDMLAWLENIPYTLDHEKREGFHLGYKAALEKQGEKQQKTPVWKHWKDGIAGNGEGKPIYLIKYGHTYSLSSCLCFECDYIKLSELDKLMLEKQETSYTKKDVDDAYIEGMAFAKYELEKQSEQKSDWSEEDQNALEDVREAIVHYWGGDTQDILLYWLKSLKRRIGGEQ